MRVVLDLPDVDAGAWLRPLLEALTAANVEWLRSHPAAPSILAPAAGVRYEREPRGVEHWQSLPALLSSGVGDCEDLAAARAAELRVSGVDASAVPVRVKIARGVGGVDLWHIVVQTPRGTEDPSRALGMDGPA